MGARLKLPEAEVATKATATAEVAAGDSTAEEEQGLAPLA